MESVLGAWAKAVVDESKARQVKKILESMVFPCIDP
jgi:hypothetical protein